MSRHPILRAIAAAALLVAAGAALSAESIIVSLGTGGDDLRGDNDNVHVRVLGNDGRELGYVANANGRRRLADHTVHAVNVRLADGATVADVGAIELETTFGTGFDGDTWHLDSIRVAPAHSTVSVLMAEEGRPLAVFTGRARKRFRVVQHACARDADCGADGRCEAAPRPLDGTPLRTCRWVAPPPCRDGQPRLPNGSCPAPQPRDMDGDGVPGMLDGGADCDDEDPRRYPGNVEVCDADGFDEDCDYTTVGFLDRDGDGHNSAQCFNWGPPRR